MQHVIHPYGVKWAMKIVRDGIPNDLKQSFDLSRAQVILFNEADLDYVLDMILHIWPTEEIEGITNHLKNSLLALRVNGLSYEIFTKCNTSFTLMV